MTQGLGFSLKYFSNKKEGRNKRDQWSKHGKQNLDNYFIWEMSIWGLLILFSLFLFILKVFIVNVLLKIESNELSIHMLNK